MSVNHWRQMLDSKWLTSADLTVADGSTRDCVVTIEKVEQGEVTNQSGKAKKPVAWFKGKSKPLALNVTNCKTIARLYGNRPADWEGKSITLYVGEASVQGDVVPAIRVRTNAPKNGKAGPPDPPPPADRTPGEEG